MADTYTESLRLLQPENGLYPDAWAPLLNGGLISLVDEAIAGRTDVNVTSSNATLTSVNGATDQARAMFLRATGSPSVSRTITVPAVPKVYVVQNTTEQTLQLSVSGGSSLSVLAGRIATVYVYPGVGIFEISLEGSIASEATAYNSLTLQLDDAVDSVTGLPVTTGLSYFTQGSFVFFSLQRFSTAQFSGVPLAYEIPPSGGVSPVWPAAIIPLVNKTFPVTIYEATAAVTGPFTKHNCLFSLNTSSVVAPSIIRVDGGTFTAGSWRRFAAGVSGCYSLTDD